MQQKTTVLSLVDWAVRQARPVNHLVNALADLVLPTTTASAGCSGCGDHCSWFCAPDGTVYELFKWYIGSTCEYACCGSPGCCRQVSPFGC
jgi:hypothetical protein